MIGYKGWKKLNIGMRELEESDTIISVADGRKHEVLGAIRIPVSFDKVTMPVEFLVVPSLPHELILGIDFCSNFRVVVDVYDRSAYSKLKKGEYEYGVQERVSDSTLKGIECKIEEVLVSYENLENEQADIINKLIARYKPTLGRDGLGCTDLYEHKIDTGDAPPKRSKYFSYSPKMLQVIHEGLDEYLKLGIIEPSVSAWSSPVIVLPKAEPGKYRWVVNLHEVNKVAKPDSYSPFKVNDILDQLRDARYLTSLDLKSAYWQIGLEKISREKTAFMVPGRGLYQFTRLPQGLNSSSAAWQRFIDSVIGYDLQPHCFVYLD